MRRLEEQIILITGSTDGLGKQVATDLAAKGARVLLHGRDPEKIRRVSGEIEEATGRHPFQTYCADLSSLADVRRLADSVTVSEPRLDVLVNNAGVGGGADPDLRELSADGFELRFAVNYLAPFLLTRQLLPLLHKGVEEGAEARIVNVASAAQQSIDFDNLMLETGYDGMRAYGQSKLALILWSFDLAERLSRTGVSVNALHPASLMDTKMVREWFGTPRATVEEGARHVERLILSEKLKGVSGVYYDQATAVRAKAQAYDPEARRRLRNISCRLCGLEAPED